MNFKNSKFIQDYKFWVPLAIVVLSALLIVVDVKMTHRKFFEARIECNRYAVNNSYVQYMNQDDGEGENVISDRGALSYEILYSSCLRDNGLKTEQF